jgi:hypothetical protein
MDDNIVRIRCYCCGCGGGCCLLPLLLLPTQLAQHRVWWLLTVRTCAEADAACVSVGRTQVTYWVDGVASVRFQVRMASGVGWVDDVREGYQMDAEANGPWGTQYIGKASGMGGWYNEWRAPFNKTLTVTVRSPRRVLLLNASEVTALGAAPSSTCNGTDGADGSDGAQPVCKRYNKTDFWGSDMGDIPDAKTFGDCCAACAAFPGCQAFSFHHQNGGSCALKSSAADPRPEGNMSGPTDAGCIHGGNSRASTVVEYGSEIYRADLAGGKVAAASVEECRSACIARRATCKAFTYYGDNPPGGGQTPCHLKSDGTNRLPSSTTTVSGTLEANADSYQHTIASGYMYVRGLYGRDTAAINIGGVPVPVRQAL